jgi:excisionase family DNA binding protein
LPRTPGAAKETNEGLNITIEIPLDILEVLRARKKAWKVPELTELPNLGRRTLYDEVEAGRLPALRIGTTIRINPSDAVIWVAARMTRVVFRAA